MRDYIFMISVIVVLALAMLIVTFSKFHLSNDQYDRMKAMVVKWPALLTFLGVLVATFHFSYGEETITIVSAIGALLAHCLGVSNKNFNEGAMVETEEWVEDGDLNE